MAGETDVSICSKALIRLGENTISSLTEGSERAEICVNTWPQLKLSILSLYPWKRTQRKKRLSRNTPAPVNEYLYSYQLPIPRLEDGVLELWNTGTSSASTISDFRIMDDDVLTNAPDVYADYQVEISEGDFGPHLVELSILALCAEIAIPITEQKSMAEHFERKAFGLPNENRQGGYYRIARQLDAKTQPPQVVDDYSLIDVRNAGVRP